MTSGTSRRPVRAGADRDGHAVPRRRLASTSTARARRRRRTSSTTATTASWSPARRASRRPPPSRRTAQILRAVIDAVGDRVDGRRRRRHQRHRALRRARRAGREARRRRRAAGDAVLQQAHARPACSAHFEAVADASRPAGDALRHPGPHRHHDRRRDLPRGSPRTTGRRGQGRRRRPVPRRPDHARHRPGVLLRRRRAQPRLADPRRRAASSRSSATSPATSTPRWSTPSTRGDLARRPRDLPRPACRSSTAIMTTAPGRDDRQGGPAAARRARQPHRPAPARARRRAPSSTAPPRPCCDRLPGSCSR